MPPIEVSGDVAPGFEPIRTAFETAFEGRPGMGAAVAVRVDGHPVADLWGGYADQRSRSPWRRDTASVIFSCTKGLVSILAARLVEEGRLDYDALVTDYWPEFGAAGKQSLRVRQLLAHQAGLSAPRDDITIDDITGWEGVIRKLEVQEPLWPLGSGHAYHAITHGWLIGEVIRRVTGISVGSFFAQAVAGPLHADAWIGLPPTERDRVAHLVADASLIDLVDDQRAARPPGGIDWEDRSITLGGVIPAQLVTDGGGFNDARIQASEIPGAGGIATARALAGIWSATIVETDGVRLLGDPVAELATRVQSEGAPVIGGPPPWQRWGMGFQLDSEAGRFVTGSGFGHFGAGGQVAFADPGSRSSFAFITNRLEGLDDRRATRIIDALRSTLTGGA